MHSLCRKFVFHAMLLSAFFFSGCSRKVYAEEKISEEKRSSVADVKSEKLSFVLSRMNPRGKDCWSRIKENKEDFFSDLDEIISEQKTFRKDDESIYRLIDKKHSVSSSYEPLDLIELKSNSLFLLNKGGMKIRPEAYEALKKMAAASKKDGITLLVSSVYRSYQYQEKLFNYWVSVDGLEEAERESARPGTSQHQLATAVDFGSISDDFDKTEMGRWVYENASDFGWSLSFPKGYEDVTGYRWECWHFRYVGVKACRFQKKWFGNVQQFMLEFLDEWK